MLMKILPRTSSYHVMWPYCGTRISSDSSSRGTGDFVCVQVAYLEDEDEICQQKVPFYPLFPPLGRHSQVLQTRRITLEMFVPFNRNHLQSKQWNLGFHLMTKTTDRSSSLTIVVIMMALFCLLGCVPPVEPARSSADIGICESHKDGRMTNIDCLSGAANFCCFDKLVHLSNVTKWSKKCCTESEYVQENK